MQDSNVTSKMGMIFGQVVAAAKPAQDGAAVTIFDDVDAPKKNDWTIKQAYLCLLLAAVWADGEAVEVEIDYVRSLIKRCKTMDGETEESLFKLNSEVMDRITKRQNYIGEACEALPRDMRLPLFAHCVDIILADGILEDSERTFLDTLVDNMDISIEEAKKVTEVMFEKNRY